jgi:hypothetical protein
MLKPGLFYSAFIHHFFFPCINLNTKQSPSHPSPLLVNDDVMALVVSLQMILQQYISSDWLQNSFQSWVQQCQVACSAESIELLREVCINLAADTLI